jgi:hypothetical protein
MKDFYGLTAKILTVPMTVTTIPAEITILQKASPSDFSLVASLFKFPKIDIPSMIIVIPRETKPEFWL